MVSAPGRRRDHATFEPARRLLKRPADMLRITRTSRPPAERLLLLEGRLIGPWVAELRRTFLEFEGTTTVDLTGVSFADEEGVDALRQLRASGAALTGVSQFLAALMGADDGSNRRTG